MKIPALFIFLAIVLSGCSAETGNQTGNQNNQANTAANAATNAPANAQTNQAAKSGDAKTDYPPVASEIMQANFEAPDGSAFKLEDYKGKVVLVNLWATWCAPCREEMPELIKMQDEHRAKGFEIVGLNIDRENEDAEIVNEFAQKMKLNYKLGWIEDEVAGHFLKISQFDGIPQSFLINREGQLTGVFLGGGKVTVGKMKETVARIVNQ